MSRGGRPFRRMLVAAILGSTVALVAAVAPAFGDSSTPTSTHVSATEYPNGTVTMTVSGNWTWPSQTCTKRWGTAWSIGWWGIGSSHPLPSNNFTLTNVSLITSPYQGQSGSPPTVGSQTAAGSIQFPSGSFKGQYLYLGTQFNGQQIFNSAFCNSLGGGTLAGTYTATATYPTKNDVPPEICVNTYDIHLDGTGPKTGDYNALTNGDYSLKQKDYTDAASCAPVTITVVPAGGSIGSLGLVGLIALGMLVLLGGQAVIRRRRSNPARG